MRSGRKLAGSFSRYRFMSGPRATWVREGAFEALQELGEIDLLFYRRDSDGEGGSRIFVLGDVFMSSLLPHFYAGQGLVFFRQDPTSEAACFVR